MPDPTPVDTLIAELRNAADWDFDSDGTLLTRAADEIERLRREQADADVLISHAEDAFDYEGITWTSHPEDHTLDEDERRRLDEVWKAAYWRGYEARGVQR